MQSIIKGSLLLSLIFLMSCTTEYQCPQTIKQCRKFSTDLSYCTNFTHNMGIKTARIDLQLKHMVGKYSSIRCIYNSNPNAGFNAIGIDCEKSGSYSFKCSRLCTMLTLTECNN